MLEPKISRQLTKEERPGIEYQSMDHLEQKRFGKALVSYLGRNIGKIRTLRKRYHTTRVKAAEVLLKEKDPMKTKIDQNLENELQVEIVKEKVTKSDGSIDTKKIPELMNKVSSYFRPGFIKTMEYILEHQANTYERILTLLERNPPQPNYTCR